MFRLKRYSNFLLEYVQQGSDFMPTNIDTENIIYGDDELSVLMSSTNIDVILNNGSNHMLTVQHSVKKDLTYNVYWTNTNNATWVLTLDHDGTNSSFSYVDGNSDCDPHLIIDVRKSGNSDRMTYYVTPNVVLWKREKFGYEFDPIEEKEDIEHELDNFPEEVCACITEFIFDYLVIKHNKEIKRENKKVYLQPEDWTDLSKAFPKDVQENVASILQGDYHEIFSYDNKAFKDNYDDAYNLVNSETEKEIKETFDIDNKEDFLNKLENDENGALNLKESLIRAYRKAQEDADSSACFEHVKNSFLRGVECEYEEGGFFVFSDTKFAKFALRMKTSNNGVDDLFENDFSFNFNDSYYGSINKEFFNQELSEILTEYN